MAMCEALENEQLPITTKKKIIDEASNPSELNISSKTKDIPSVEFLLKQVYYAHRSNIKALENALTTANEVIEDLREKIKRLRIIVAGLENDKKDLKAVNSHLEQQLAHISFRNSKMTKEVNNSLGDADLFVGKNISKKNPLKLMRTKRRCLYSENKALSKRTKNTLKNTDCNKVTNSVTQFNINRIDLVAGEMFALDTCNSFSENMNNPKYMQFSCENAYSGEDVFCVPETLCINSEKINTAKQKCSNEYLKKDKELSSQNNPLLEDIEKHTMKIENKQQSVLNTPLLLVEKSPSDNSSLMDISDHKSPALFWPNPPENNHSSDLQNKLLFMKNQLLQNANLHTVSKDASNCEFDETILNPEVDKIENGNQITLTQHWENVNETFLSTKNKDVLISDEIELNAKHFPTTPESKSFKAPTFKYVEDAIRNHDERKRLQGFTCKCCQEFYENIPEEERVKHLKHCSRHRALFAPSKTPEHYWSVDFPNTQECKKRGYMNDTQKKPFLSRRKRPLKKL